jgi:hypothetical protein
MKNLNQIRAANAITHRNNIANAQNDGDAISGFPSLILTDGLLAALTFACEWKDSDHRPDGAEDMRRQVQRPAPNGQPRQQWQKRKHPGEYTITRAIAAHLKSSDIGIIRASLPDELVSELAREDDDLKLRRATAEAIPFLSYLKRFVA